MKKILFYCSGNGFGHIARVFSVVKFLNNCQIVICSPQDWIFGPLPNLKFVKLEQPKSYYKFTDKGVERDDQRDIDDTESFRKYFGHYIKTLLGEKPNFVVVDLNAEIASVTKLLGFKTLIMYETLKTNDFQVEFAWQNADAILVPYSKSFTENLNYRFADKSFFSGAFSRYEGEKFPARVDSRESLGIKDNEVTCLITMGKARLGESVIPQIIESVINRSNFRTYFLYYSKDDWIESLQKLFPSLKVIFAKTDIRQYYSAADLVLSGAGYNTVTELFEAQVPAILFPLERDFDEQVNKAKTIESLGAAEIVDLNNRDWESQFNKKINHLIKPDVSKRMKDSQEKIVDGHGAERMAKFIEEF